MSRRVAAGPCLHPAPSASDRPPRLHGVASQGAGCPPVLALFKPLILVSLRLHVSFGVGLPVSTAAFLAWSVLPAPAPPHPALIPSAGRCRVVTLRAGRVCAPSTVRAAEIVPCEHHHSLGGGQDWPRCAGPVGHLSCWQEAEVDRVSWVLRDLSHLLRSFPLLGAPRGALCSAACRTPALGHMPSASGSQQGPCTSRFYGLSDVRRERVVWGHT